MGLGRLDKKYARRAFHDARPKLCIVHIGTGFSCSSQDLVSFVIIEARAYWKIHILGMFFAQKGNIHSCLVKTVDSNYHLVDILCYQTDDVLCPFDND